MWKVKVTSFPSLDSCQLCLTVEADMTTLSVVLLNVCRGNIQDNYNKERGRAIKGGKLSTSYSNW